MGRKLRTRESDQLPAVLELHDMEIQKMSVPTYQKLRTMVKRSFDQKLRLRNSDARHGRIETGAVVNYRKGMSGVEEEKVFVTSGKQKGQCWKRDQVSGRRVTIVPKNPEHTAAKPSEPSLSRGRSVSRKRSIQGKSNHGAILRQPCRYYWRVCARDRLVNVGIRPSANPTKKKRGAKPGMSVCSRIIRLMNNQTRLLFPHKKTPRYEI